MLAVVALSFQNLQIWRRFIWCSVLIYSLSLGVPGAITSVFMDPDPTTAAAPNLDLVAQWASLDGTRDDVHTARGSLFQLLGFHGAERPRFIGIMASLSLAQWTITPVHTPGAPAPPPVAPNFAQRSQAGVFARTCRVLTGTQVSTAVQPPPVPPAPSTSGTKKITMSQVINQADDDEIEPMDQTQVHQAYANYHTRTGGFPPEDEELSAEQLATLNSVYQSGRTPYTDMSIWGPYQLRIQKRIKKRGVRLSPTGDITTVETFGPGNYESRTGSIMLDQISSSRLDNY